MHKSTEYMYIDIFSYLEPSHCVEQRNVNSRELLKRKEQEEYR